MELLLGNIWEIFLKGLERRWLLGKYEFFETQRSVRIVENRGELWKPCHRYGHYDLRCLQKQSRLVSAV